MRKILLATQNPGKVVELRAQLEGLAFEVIGAAEFGLDLDVIEDADTFIGNAEKKAREFAHASGLWALADDSGLEVDALDGAPGVFSARYAGPDASADENNEKLLQAIRGRTERGARFRCVLVLADETGQVLHTTAGVVEGELLDQPRGEGGFGYDPLFVPVGRDETMAELPLGAKAAISHRGLAVKAMVRWLSDQA